jgi:ABC-type branched-subunit amino acid transport system substrate-binding protein
LSKGKGICITQHEIISLTAGDSAMDSVLQQLASNDATNVVVVYAEATGARKVLQAASRQNLRGEFIWIGSSQWGIDSTVTEGLETIAEGALTITLGNAATGSPAFYNYLEDLNNSSTNAWVLEYLAYLQKSKLTGIVLDIYTQYTILAVDILLNAVETARASVCNGDGICTEFINSANRQALIRNAVASGTHGLMFDTSTGNSKSTKYDIYNFRAPHGNLASHGYVKVSHNTRKPLF